VPEPLEDIRKSFRINYPAAFTKAVRDTDPRLSVVRVGQGTYAVVLDARQQLHEEVNPERFGIRIVFRIDNGRAEYTEVEIGAESVPREQVEALAAAIQDRFTNILMEQVSTAPISLWLSRELERRFKAIQIVRGHAYFMPLTPGLDEFIQALRDFASRLGKSSVHVFTVTGNDLLEVASVIELVREYVDNMIEQATNEALRYQSEGKVDKVGKIAERVMKEIAAYEAVMVAVGASLDEEKNRFLSALSGGAL